MYRSCHADGTSGDPATVTSGRGRVDDARSCIAAEGVLRSVIDLGEIIGPRRRLLAPLPGAARRAA
jgi:hypothetical protein